MKVVLIGASGFVGTRLMNLLDKEDNYTLRNIDLVQNHFFPQYTALGDVRIFQQLNNQFAEFAMGGGLI